jgi:hypothetical protein
MKDYACMTLALTNASLEWWVVINNELAILDAWHNNKNKYKLSVFSSSI